MRFIDFISESSYDRKSRVVLALDLSSFPRGDKFSSLKDDALKILSITNPYICAVKINMQLLLPLGLYDGLAGIIEKAHQLGLPVIMDCKLSDVGHTNMWAASHYFEAGFDAMIINPIVGWEGGAQPVFEVAEKYGGRGIILLVYTSHKAAPESYELLVKSPGSESFRPLYLLFAERALRWGASGVIVGGTYPKKIREVSEVLDDNVPIFSPGIGRQGGLIEDCLRMGANYFIIGRSIFQAEDPASAAKRFRDLSWSTPL